MAAPDAAGPRSVHCGADAFDRALTPDAQREADQRGGCGLARRETIDTDGVVAEAWALCGEDAEIEFDTPKFTQHKG
ncbi:hypothetical protein G3O06_46435, partial [Burkholderia sp. Ac-20345]|uniref:hypothetical protein n=1 Tax=Burkholderia sp. Ac-20345 TaxID=2703891 RepID=UPI00197CADF5